MTLRVPMFTNQDEIQRFYSNYNNLKIESDFDSPECTLTVAGRELSIQVFRGDKQIDPNCYDADWEQVAMMVLKILETKGIINPLTLDESPKTIDFELNKNGIFQSNKKIGDYENPSADLNCTEHRTKLVAFLLAEPAPIEEVPAPTEDQVDAPVDGASGSLPDNIQVVITPLSGIRWDMPNKGNKVQKSKRVDDLTMRHAGVSGDLSEFDPLEPKQIGKNPLTWVGGNSLKAGGKFTGHARIEKLTGETLEGHFENNNFLQGRITVDSTGIEYWGYFVKGLLNGENSKMILKKDKSVIIGNAQGGIIDGIKRNDKGEEIERGIFDISGERVDDKKKSTKQQLRATIKRNAVNNLAKTAHDGHDAPRLTKDALAKVNALSKKMPQTPPKA